MRGVRGGLGVLGVQAGSTLAPRSSRAKPFGSCAAAARPISLAGAVTVVVASLTEILSVLTSKKIQTLMK